MEEKKRILVGMLEKHEGDTIEQPCFVCGKRTYFAKNCIPEDLKVIDLICNLCFVRKFGSKITAKEFRIPKPLERFIRERYNMSPEKARALLAKKVRERANAEKNRMGVGG